MIRSSEKFSAALGGYRSNLSRSGEATRALRKVTGRIARSVDILLESEKRLMSWKGLLPPEALERPEIP